MRVARHCATRAMPAKSMRAAGLEEEERNLQACDELAVAREGGSAEHRVDAKLAESEKSSRSPRVLTNLKNLSVKNGKG